MEKLKEQLTDKGRELNAFKLKHNIRFQDESEPENKAGDSTTNSDSKSEQPSQGVLVS